MSTPPGEGGSPPSQPPHQPWSWEANTPPPEPTDAGLSWDPPAAAPATSEARDPATGLAEEGGSLPPPPVYTPPAPVEASPPPPGQYPTRFAVDYPDRMSRWKTLLRLVLLIPVWLAGMLVGTLLTFGVLAGFMTVFWRKKYPDWLFRGNAGALGFLARSFPFVLVDFAVLVGIKAFAQLLLILFPVIDQMNQHIANASLRSSRPGFVLPKHIHRLSGQNQRFRVSILISHCMDD